MSKTVTRFDTGIEGSNAHRFQAVQKAIIESKTKPSVYALKKYWNCSQNVATRYLDAMESKGLLTRNSKGHRLLATLHTETSDV